MSKIVTFDQAKRLKEFGYNRECLYWYNENGVKECPIEQGYMEYYYEVDCFLNDWNAKKISRDLYGSYPPIESCSAPTLFEALDWIREEKEIACGVGLNVNSDNRFLGNYIYEYVIDNNRVKGCSGFDTHPLAESALLDAVLTYLEEKKL